MKFGTRRAKLEGKRDIITCVYFSVYRCKKGGRMLARVKFHLHLQYCHCWPDVVFK